MSCLVKLVVHMEHMDMTMTAGAAMTVLRCICVKYPRCLTVSWLRLCSGSGGG